MERTANTFPAIRFDTVLKLAAAPFRAIGRFLVMLAETGPRMEAIRHLNAMSDTELQAKGLTRDGEVRRIFGGSLHL
jgi:uncharacterized protein YjiS (DUF1127 family)